MNPVERVIYDLVKRNPRLKLALRNTYQRILDWAPVPKLKSAFQIQAREGFFFGFHEHSSFSFDDQYLAAGKYPPASANPMRMPTPKDALKIGYFTGPNWQEWQPLAKTYAWNWHQGCKLQWRGQTHELIFNDHENKTNVARIVNPGTGQQRTIPQSIATVAPNGNTAISYNFERVERYMPGYGYPYQTGTPQLDTKRPDRDGIYSINLRTGESRLLFSIADIAAMVKDEPTAANAWHFHSHALFSPSGQRFAFLHRWTCNDPRQRWSKIVTSDLDGQDIRIYPNREMASHLAWRNHNDLLVYCRDTNLRDGYVIFDDRNPDNWRRVGDRTFNSDGHPSFDPTGNIFVTDTYPDRFRIQRLELYDLRKKRKTTIAKLKTYRRFASLDPYRHWACDLHPRFDHSGRYICFDATYTGKRALCTVDLGKTATHSKNGGPAV